MIKRYWKTPYALYNALNEEFNFDYDPCPYPRPRNYDSLNEEWESGTSISDVNDFELEPLVATGYQKQVLLLKEEIKKLKSKKITDTEKHNLT